MRFNVVRSYQPTRHITVDQNTFIAAVRAAEGFAAQDWQRSHVITPSFTYMVVPVGVTLAPSLNYLAADTVFPHDYDANFMSDVFATEHHQQHVIGPVLRRVLGGERVEMKDVSWLHFGIENCVGMDALARSLGVANDQVICAIATLGDREIVFTCDL